MPWYAKYAYLFRLHYRTIRLIAGKFQGQEICAQHTKDQPLSPGHGGKDTGTPVVQASIHGESFAERIVALLCAASVVVTIGDGTLGSGAGRRSWRQRSGNISLNFGLRWLKSWETRAKSFRSASDDVIDPAVDSSSTMNDSNPFGR